MELSINLSRATIDNYFTNIKILLLLQIKYKIMFVVVSPAIVFVVVVVSLFDRSWTNVYLYCFNGRDVFLPAVRRIYLKTYVILMLFLLSLLHIGAIYTFIKIYSYIHHTRA